MNKVIVLVVSAMLLLTACSASSNNSMNDSDKGPGSGLSTVTDCTGRQVEIPQVVETVVCVGVGSLRFTAYMQAADLVVGVEQHEIDADISRPFNYINSAHFSKLPITGDNGATYDEEIVKLNPDVVIAALDGAAADALQQKLGVPVVAIATIDKLFGDEIYDTLSLLGEVYGHQDRANELIAYIKGLEKDLNDRTANIPDDDKPAVYAGGISFKGVHGFDGTEAGYSPFLAIGAKNLADETGKTGAFNIDLEQVLKWDPDIIFLDFNGMDLINEDYGENPDYYDALSAVRKGRVYSQISFRSYAMNAELAFVDAYYAGKIIFPDQFSDVDPVAKADEIFETMLGVKFYNTLKDNGYEFKKMVIGE